MLSLTKQERIVLLIFALVMLVGSSIHFAFNRYPGLKDSINWVNSDRLHYKVDINLASMEELVLIPYIGEYTASNIIDYRLKNGPFTSLDQLKSVKGIRDKNYEKFYKYLIIR